MILSDYLKEEQFETEVNLLRNMSLPVGSMITECPHLNHY